MLELWWKCITSFIPTSPTNWRRERSKYISSVLTTFFDPTTTTFSIWKNLDTGKPPKQNEIKDAKKNSFFSRISDPAITKPYSIKIIEFTVKKPSIEHFDKKKNTYKTRNPIFHALLPHFFLPNLVWKKVRRKECFFSLSVSLSFFSMVFLVSFLSACSSVFM